MYSQHNISSAWSDQETYLFGLSNIYLELSWMGFFQSAAKLGLKKGSTIIK